MINPEFYEDSTNQVFYFYEGKRPHFPLREPAVTTDSRVRALEYGETLHNISEAVFGKGRDFYWPYLSDCNVTRHPDDWLLEDKLVIPKTIVVPKAKNERTF